MSQAWQVWNGLDAWLHIAGADVLTGANARLSFEAKLELLWAVDVAATIRLCRAVGQRMRDQGHGAIVTMGWDQAERGMEGDSGELFATTKGAVMAFTQPGLSLAPAVARQLPGPRLDQDRMGRDGFRSLAGSRPPRDAHGTLGNSPGCRPRGTVSYQSGSRVHHRTDHPGQRRGRQITGEAKRTITGCLLLLVTDLDRGE